MFIYSPSEEILALDAATGKKLWSFDSGVKATQPSRGFSYWTDGKQSILFAGVMDHLYALDPATGHPISSFGDGGSVDLRKDLGNEDFASNFAVLTTPGTIYKDMIIVGFRAPETHPAPHGDIRAYDVHSGKLRWSFHTIPHPGEPGYETWPKDAWKTAGAANNWAGMVVDQAARHRLRPNRLGGRRLLWRRPRWQRPLRQYPARARRQHRQAHLVFPGSSPRHLGPRLPLPAGSGDGSSATANRLTQSPRPASKASSISLNARPASRSFPWKKSPTPHRPSLAK